MLMYGETFYCIKSILIKIVYIWLLAMFELPDSHTQNKQ